MRFLLCFLMLFSTLGWSQVKRVDKKLNRTTINSGRVQPTNSVDRFSSMNLAGNDTIKANRIVTVAGDTVAPISSYKIFNELKGASTFDTILDVKKQYAQNYLRKDTFGLLGFSNDGQTYQAFDPNFLHLQNIINLGFNARRFSYLNKEDINYYNVPTPASELFYRSVTGKGQNLDALLTVNISEQFNAFIGYRGMRSQGKYVNQQTSNGNFRIGSSYFTKNKRYQFKNHITFQDIYNDENGGVFNTALFESSDEPYNKREQIRVQFDNSKTRFKGLRTYLDQSFQFNKSESNKALIRHQFTYEYFSNRFEQDNANPFNNSKPYFGTSFSSSIFDKVQFYQFENDVDLAFNSTKIGLFAVSAGFFNSKFSYNSVIFDSNNQKIPNFLKDDIVTLGGSYILNKKNYTADINFKQSVIGRSLTNLNAKASININDSYGLDVQYQLQSKVPDYTFQLFQSDYTYYNWHHNFANEKYNTLNATLNTPWVVLSGTYQLITDKLYFSNDATTVNANNRYTQQLVTPKQYGKVINYLSVKAQKEFKYRKWALDNTVMFQQVVQDNDILNVPQVITRNTLYYSDYVFDKALFLQTGITFNYFTKYFANEYNPILGDFVVQNQVKVGNFPMFDFFLNAKIKTAQIYINVEHFNSKFTGYNYYNTPTQPYRDLTVRLGIKWNFFN